MPVQMDSTRRLRPFGAVLDVTSDDGRVFDALAAAVARFPRAAGVDARGSLLVRTTRADEPGDPAWPHTATAWDGALLEVRCGSARLAVDARAGRAELTLPPSLAGVPDAVRMFVEGAVSAWLIGAGHLRAVHSGMVTAGRTGLVLRGPSGAGKSTLTYACWRAGFGVVSDDWVYAVVGAGASTLWGYPWRLFLVPGSERFFPELAATVAVPHPGADRWKLPVEPPVGARRRSASVDAVVLLDPSSSLGYERIDADEAHQRFWAPALPTERTDLPPGFVSDLLDRPCYVLRRGTDPMAAATMLWRLAGEVRASA